MDKSKLNSWWLLSLHFCTWMIHMKLILFLYLKLSLILRRYCIFILKRCKIWYPCARCWIYIGVFFNYRIVLAVAFSMLIIGTLANSRSRKSCGMFNRRFLSIGGILCFIHGLFTVPYYVSATATIREAERQHGNSGPAVWHTW